MKYNKPPLSINQQLEKLRSRGLIIKNEETAYRYLSNISYYRLRAYTFPYQDNDAEQQPFIGSVSIEHIMELYTFDRRLRLLIFDAIERIEIALRTQIIYQWALKHGSHWHTMQELYKDDVKFTSHFESLHKEIRRCNETFIKHYSAKYTSPEEHPAWMGLEVTSIGLLSLIFQNLKNCPEKKAVTHHFGLLSPAILENWIHNFCNVRNICAHHGRLWNRRLPTHLNIPKKTLYPFVQKRELIPYKLYASLTAMVYCMEIINPRKPLQKKIIQAFKNMPSASA